VRTKVEVEYLRHQQSVAVDTPTSAKHFTQKVLELATQQQEVERQQRKERGSVVSNGESRSPEQNNISSISRAHGNNPTRFGSDMEAGVEITTTEQRSSSSFAPRDSSPSAPPRESSPSAPLRESSPSAPPRELSPSVPPRELSPSVPPRESSPSAPPRELSPSAPPRESSPAAPMREFSPSAPEQCQRPAGSVPTALPGDSPEHQRYQQEPQVFGPVIHDDGNRIHETNRLWRTRRSSHESISHV
jgi:hypothetical protein